MERLFAIAWNDCSTCVESAIGANLCDNVEHGEMSGVVGSNATSPRAHSGDDEFPQDIHYIDSPFGGYGLYYRTVMIEMGLVLPGGPGFPLPVDALTPDLGMPLADAFESAVADTRYVRDYLGRLDTPVPRDVALEFGRRACLCQLRGGSAPDLEQLRDIFVHQGKEPESRRATMRMFVDIAAQTDGHAVTQDEFRRFVFYGASRSGARYAPSQHSVSRAGEWRFYQAHEYYAFALNTLWRHLCDWGVDQGGTLHPVPPEAYRAHLEPACDFTGLSDVLGLGIACPRADSSTTELLEWVASANGTSIEHFDLESTLDSPLSEDALVALVGRGARPEVADVQAMLVILAMILVRYGSVNRASEQDWWVAQAGGAGRLSIEYFCRRVREGGLLDATVLDFAVWLHEIIISQHIRTAAGKLPENTFRFNYDHGGLTFTRLDNPIVFNDSRFGAITTTVLELGLCGDLRVADHAPTALGRRFLETGDV